MSIEISEISDMAGFNDIEAAWHALSRTSGNGDFYVSYNWYSAYLRATSSPPEQLHILVCRDAGEVVAIVPLCIVKHRMRVFEMRALELIGNVYTPFRSALVERRFMSQVIHALIDHLVASKACIWDILKLDDISVADPFIVALTDTTSQYGIAVRRVPGEVTVSVDLATYTDSADYFSHLKKNFRQNIRTSINRMNKAGRFRVVLAHGDATELDSIMDDYYQIYDGSWKEAEGDPDFHRRLAHDMAAKNCLRLFQLYFRVPVEASEIGEKDTQIPKWSDPVDPGAHRPGHDYVPVSSVYFIIYNGRAYCLKMSYRDGYEKLSPGTVLLWYAIQHLMDQDAIRIIDFQKGDEAYKHRWGGRVQRRSTCYIYNNRSLAARLEYACEKMLVPLARHVRRNVTAFIGKCR